MIFIMANYINLSYYDNSTIIKSRFFSSEAMRIKSSYTSKIENVINRDIKAVKHKYKVLNNVIQI